MAAPELLIAGGTYREWCLHPSWREVYGSAGRAASTVAALGLPATLHTHADASASDLLAQRAALEGFAVALTAVPSIAQFDYDHGLATPRILRPEAPYPVLDVAGKNILRFGMIHGDAVVRGRSVVYDPQDAFTPQSFLANGSSAQRLAIVLNRHEATLLTQMPGSSTSRELAQGVARQEGAHVVILKNGACGAVVLENGELAEIPAYRTSNVWKIGSGDTFSAGFAARWLLEGRSAVESAQLASQGTAYYCETRGFLTPQALPGFTAAPIRPTASYVSGTRRKVYLAGPFFTLAQMWQIEQARMDLTHAGLEVFSPFHDVGRGSADDVVPEDLAAIQTCDLMFAIGDGTDPGTVYEVGFARALDKPVVVYCENEPEERIKMMEGSGCELLTDYVTAVYHALWRACEL